MHALDRDVLRTFGRDRRGAVVRSDAPHCASTRETTFSVDLLCRVGRDSSTAKACAPRRPSEWL